MSVKCERGCGRAVSEPLLHLCNRKAVVEQIAGDLLDVIGNSEQLAAVDIVTGKACVTENDAGATGRYKMSWKESKEYQRFIEDQRIAENMGLVEKSAVTAFLEDHYAKYPLDNSYEGILARQTGLTKDEVIAVLDEMEQLEFLANYDPTNYYPVLPTMKVAYNADFKDEYANMHQLNIYKNIQYVAYFDTRNRSFAI